MLGYFLALIRQKRDSDYVQSLLNCFLKMHYDLIVDDEDLISKVNAVQKEREMGY
jgi:hypothetical protein